MGWFLVADGATYLAFMLWSIYRARTLEDSSRRALSVKYAILCGAQVCLVLAACLALAFGMKPLDAMMRALAAHGIVFGFWVLWLPWQMPQATVDRFGSAPAYPTLLRAFAVVKGGVVATIIGLGLTTELLLTFPDSVYNFATMFMLVLVAGGVILVGAVMVAAVIGIRLETDAEMEVWRRRHGGQ